MAWAQACISSISWFLIWIANFTTVSKTATSHTPLIIGLKLATLSSLSVLLKFIRSILSLIINHIHRIRVFTTWVYRAWIFWEIPFLSRRINDLWFFRIPLDYATARMHAHTHHDHVLSYICELTCCRHRMRRHCGSNSLAYKFAWMLSLSRFLKLSFEILKYLVILSLLFAVFPIYFV